MFPVRKNPFKFNYVIKLDMFNVNVTLLIWMPLAFKYARDYKSAGRWSTLINYPKR